MLSSSWVRWAPDIQHHVEISIPACGLTEVNCCSFGRHPGALLGPVVEHTIHPSIRRLRQAHL